MRARPKSRFENEDGSIRWWEVGDDPEYAEVVKWDKEFADECDRLAALEAEKTGKRHWGRWYLTKSALATRTSRPEVGKRGVRRGGIYDIGLDRLNKGSSEYGWVEHMGAKNWMGEQGLKDLAQALKDLIELTK